MATDPVPAVATPVKPAKTVMGTTTIPSVAYSVLMAALGGLFFMGTVYFAAKASNVIRRKLFFHALIFGVFFGLYMVMPTGFENHFNVPEKKKMTLADVAYYTMVVHSTAGFGDIYPTTFYARSCVATHLGLVFLATTGILSALV